MIERSPLNTESNRGSSVNLPILFALLHPLKEISPVIMKTTSPKSSQLGYMTTQEDFEIIAVIESRSLCVIFNKTECCHSVWLVRKAANEEIKTICNAGATSTITVNAENSNSPYIPPGQSFNTQTLTQTYFDSPMATIGSSRQMQTSSPSISGISTIGKTHASSNSSSSYLSPLRSSRLAASPASPQLRSYNTSLGNTLTTKTSFDYATYSPSTRLSLTPRRTCEVDVLNDFIEDPFVPELCVEHVWGDTFKTTNTKASKVFLSTDFMEQEYLCFLLPQEQQLKMIRLIQSGSEEKPLIFGTSSSISAKDAESLSDLKMIIVQESNGQLSLYSGISKVSNVHLPSIIGPILNSSSDEPVSPLSPISKRTSLVTSSRPASASGHHPSFLSESRLLSPVINEESNVSISDFSLNRSYQQVSNVVSLKDAIGSSVSVETAASQHFRFSLPPICSSSVVKICLNALKTVLPKDISTQLLIKWYAKRNAPGSNDLSPQTELHLFHACLLSLMGYSIENMQLEFNFSKFMNGSGSPKDKRIKLDADENGTDEDWEILMKELNEESRPQNVSLVQVDSTALLFPYFPHILFALHLIYEEFKLNVHTWNDAEELSKLLYPIASDLKLVSYQDHYWRDFPFKCLKNFYIGQITDSDKQAFLKPTYFTENCPSIYKSLFDLIACSDINSFGKFPFLVNVNTMIPKLVSLYANLCCSEYIPQIKLLLPIFYSKNISDEKFERVYQNIFEKCILLMDFLDVEKTTLETLPPGVSIPFWDAIFRCRHNPGNDWSASCYSLIGRTELTALIESNKLRFKPSSRKHAVVQGDFDDDGINYLDPEVFRLLFPEDQRLQEAHLMLNSSKPVKVSIQQKPGVTDHDFIEEQERHLYTLCIRTMALPLGRGMLTLRSYVPIIAETFPIPKLSLVGRVPPRNTTIEISHIEVPPNMNMWPLFHNGVAAGLRILSSASHNMIDSTWIVYNGPKSNTAQANEAIYEHAGFLLALGLNGHLDRLSTMSIHDYLCKGNEMTRVAVLLGLASAKRGSMDLSTVKTLSIHVEALLPPTSTELDVPPVVQVAAVLGIGLLYQGSGQHHIAEVLLGEIGRPPGPEMEHYIDRESYALAAGLALGLVTLAKGDEMTGLVSASDSIPVADQLCHFMLGGHKRPLTATQREKYKAPSYQIREGDCINADVTSPGATLALGLMFHKTNNEAVAKWVTAPDTQYLLEMVRPDFLLLRTLCHGLIMWSEVRPTKSWVESHVPKIVADHAFHRDGNRLERIDYETMSQAYCNIVAGACFVLGLKYAGSAEIHAFTTVMHYSQMFMNLMSKPVMAELAGRSTIEACINILVISLAMIMAGTGNLEVLRICRYLRSRISQAYVLYGSHMATHMAMGLLFLGGCRYTLNTSPESIAALICAFFPKFPIHSNDNRYHLQAFRHLYVLAVEPRLVIPRDIDTRKTVYVHLRYRLKGEAAFAELRAPCFIPELHLIEEIIVDDNRYWKISFERNKNWHILTLV